MPPYKYVQKQGADISERTLYDVYLRPWRDYARNGGRGAMMSYVFL